MSLVLISYFDLGFYIPVSPTVPKPFDFVGLSFNWALVVPGAYHGAIERN
jgi:hypothetical protein